MKRFGNPLLSFAAPFLFLLASLGLLLRQGGERFQCLPAFCVSGGLIIAGSVRRVRRRQMLLYEITRNKEEEI